MARIKSVYQAMFSVFFVSKICGLTPFALKREYSHSTWQFIYPLLCTLVFISASVFEFFTRQSWDNDTLYSTLDTLLLIEASLNTVIIFSSEMIFSKKMVKWLHNLEKLDKSIIGMKLSIDLEKEFYKTTLGCLIGTAIAVSTALFIFIVDILCFIPSDVYKFLSNISYSFPIVACNIMFLKFCSLLLVLRRRYRWLNISISNWKTKFHKTHAINILTFNQSMYFGERQILSLNNIRTKYLRLNKLTEELVKMYALPLLFSFLQIFITFQTYSLYFIKSPSTQFTQKRTSLYQFFGKGIVAIGVMQLVLASFVGSTISKEASKTSVILNDIRSGSDELDEYINYFLCQLIHNNVEITVCNVFEIRTSLIFTVFSSLASYLVLIIQLHIQ